MTNTEPKPTKTALRRVVAASIVGSTLEWYDFFLYATASALVLGPVFFPTTDPAVGTLLSFATFGVGFAARPIGSIIFGAIGDRLGRKPALVATLVLMGVSTALIGLVPGYASIGILAPIALVVLRLLQGLGAGAELAGATIFAAEYAPRHRRGLFGSIATIGTYSGTVLSSVIFALFAMMPEATFMAWGWRIPFLLSILVIAVGIYVRLRLEETPEFKRVERADKTTKAPLLDMFRYEWRSVLLVLGIVAAPFTATYAYQTYSLSYMDTELGVSGATGTLAVAIAAFLAMFVVPLMGALSDKVGRRPILIAGTLISALFAFPFFMLLNTGNRNLIILAMIGGIGIGVPTILGVQGVLLSELFSTANRFTGFSVSREIGSILFAGATPFVAASLVAASGGQSWPVSLYVIGACVITLITGIVMKEPGSLSEPAAAEPTRPTHQDPA
ncbi:metabolite-proton symporter [Stackebrandtia endophytica]|uniref:Putative proline/betaine transporter n=1 Tax=Stackebrandtia endophytica TaxID=1496996 RepID=A0A543AVU3_9ACTN|nr:MFS transporter [Stackebrandtia endophytica]TQL76661.1 metabolite-proton symporter [Stackebrandtia endophytica]